MDADDGCIEILDYGNFLLILVSDWPLQFGQHVKACTTINDESGKCASCVQSLCREGPQSRVLHVKAAIYI